MEGILIRTIKSYISLIIENYSGHGVEHIYMSDIIQVMKLYSVSLGDVLTLLEELEQLKIIEIVQPPTNETKLNAGVASINNLVPYTWVVN